MSHIEADKINKTFTLPEERDDPKQTQESKENSQSVDSNSFFNIERYFLVKFKNKPHFLAQLIDEKTILTMSKQKLSIFLNRWYEAFQDTNLLLESYKDVNKMYFHGIHKEYLQPDHIIDTMKYQDEDIWYLVKWNEFEYEYWSWENKRLIEIDYPELKIQYQEIIEFESNCIWSTRFKQSVIKT